MNEPDVITCEQALQHLFDYLDHELDSGVHHKMEQHLSTCQSCFSRFEFEKRLKSRMLKLGGEKASDELRERINTIVSKFADD